MGDERQGGVWAVISARGPERWIRPAALAAGLVMAVIGGAIKVAEVLRDPALFEYVFFSGVSYIVMICGVTLVIVSISYPLFFGGEGEDS